MTQTWQQWPHSSSPLELVIAHAPDLVSPLPKGFRLSKDGITEDFTLQGPFAYGRGGLFDLTYMSDRYGCFATLDDFAFDDEVTDTCGLNEIPGLRIATGETWVIKYEYLVTHSIIEVPRGRLWMTEYGNVEAVMCNEDNHHCVTLHIGGVVADIHLSNPQPREFKVTPENLNRIFDALANHTAHTLSLIPEDFETNPIYLVPES